MPTRCSERQWEANGVVRHIQLKASHRLAKAAKLDTQVNLARPPSACVIWIQFDADTGQPHNGDRKLLR